MIRPVMRKGEWLECIVEEKEQAAANLLVWLAAHLRLPVKWLANLSHNGHIQLRGDRLLMKLFPEESIDYIPEWTNLDVLYEDDFCLIVNKPAGLAVHPASKEQKGTLANAVAGYYESTGQAVAVRHVHRLDEYTSGPVLYAKNRFAQVVLDEAMRNKAIDRIYAAIVTGTVADERGVLTWPIGRDRHHSGKRRVSATGQPAVTRYEVVRRFAGHTLLRLRLETGRTHQIRVHLSHMGHPIVGDQLYGKGSPVIGRQALHGKQLNFAHPFTNEQIGIQCPWPDELTAVLRHLEK